MKTAKLPLVLVAFFCLVFGAQAAVNLKLATHPVDDPHQIIDSEHFNNESFVAADFGPWKRRSNDDISAKR